MNKKILVLHGPNLNLLGTREPEHYGKLTLKEINAELIAVGLQHNIQIECYQSNQEGELINKTQEAVANKYDFMLINPGGYTHTSVAWRDAIVAVQVPFIEIHLSNVYAREHFRHNSFFSDIALGVVAGFGNFSYTMALNYAINFLGKKDTN